MAERHFSETLNDHTQLRKHETLHNSILYENGALRYDFMTSLQNIAMAKIIINLWMNQKTELGKLNLDPKYRCRGQWARIEKTVLTELSELLLPEHLIMKLENIVLTIGLSIFHWIKYNDEYIFKSDRYSSVDQISNLAWTARGNVDYAQTARNILANPYSALSDEHKYKLACNFCLENEIDVLAPNVSNQDYIKDIKIESHTMECFWTAKLTGDNRILDAPRHMYNRILGIPSQPFIFRLSQMRKKEILFKFLIINDGTRVKRECNEVAIRHLWNELNEEEKARNISLVFKILGNEDLRYSLLSSLDYGQQQKVFGECSGLILRDIFNDWLWGEYFLPTALQALPAMGQFSYKDLLNKIIKEMDSNYDEGNKCIYDRYRSIFKQLWQESPSHLKDFVIKDRNGYIVQSILITSLTRKQDMDVISLIFNDLNAQQKRNIIFGDDCILHCAGFIQDGRWDLLKLFIEYTLCSEEDIDYLKRRLVHDRGQRIVSELVAREALDKIEQFLRWGFKSEDRINEFKRSLANFDALSKFIVDKNNPDYRKIKNHFEWCTNGDQEMTNRLKVEFPTSISGKYLILLLIRKENYQMLDAFLDWCFLKNKKQIKAFKSNLYKDEQYFARRLVYILRKKENCLKKLFQFTDWSFTNDDGTRILMLMLPSRRREFIRSYVDMDEGILDLTVGTDLD